MENKTKLFNEDDLEVAVAFLEEKGCLTKNSQKKLDVEAYLDNGGNSIVVVSSKKRPGFLKSVLNQKVLAVYEIRANEDYSVLVQLPGSYEPLTVERNVYYPHFKEAYLESKKEQQNAEPERQ